MLKDPLARIVGKKSWGDYFLLALESPRISAQTQPGQFIMVRVNAPPSPLLRRPFSIHSTNERTIEIFFQITGLGTELLSQHDPEDTLDILGPLGKGFDAGEELKGKNIAVVGGGRGIAPLYFLSQELQSLGASPRVFYGGKSQADLPLKEKFEEEDIELTCSTDDGSFGFKGFVSDLFKEELEKFTPHRIFACGPEAMMKKISGIAQEKDIPAEFSLESIMGCGFGACWGCVRRIKRDDKEEWVKICEEGPVFSGKDIIWEEEDA
ncbi:MAG: dihydroorotate dehydrogenase electron transfer subunit [Candidatus Aminicenantes bacterium]